MTDEESAAYEAEILRVWDELPDYVKTQSLLDKLKDSCPPSLMGKLEKREHDTPLIVADDEGNP